MAYQRDPLKKGAGYLKWRGTVSIFVGVALIFQATYGLEQLNRIQANHHSPTIREEVVLPNLTIPTVPTETVQNVGVEIADEIEQIDEEEITLEEKLFDIVYERSGSYYLAAAIVGNAMYESHLISYRWEGDLEKDENGVYAISRKATDRVNALIDQKEYGKAKNTFVNMNPMQNWSGFGLFGFTCYGMKEMLVDFAISTGRHIDDPEMQVEFVMYYIQAEHPDLWQRLLDDESPKDCALRFAGGFEKCIDSDTSYYYRAYYAKKLYNEYGNGESYEN